LLLLALAVWPLAAWAQEPANKPEPRVRLELRDAPLGPVLRALAEKTGRTLVLPEGAPERVNLSFAEMPAGEAFDQLLALHGYEKKLDGDKVVVTKIGARVAPVPTPIAPVASDVAPVPSAASVPPVAPEVTASPDTIVGRVYVLHRISCAAAAAGIAKATSDRASVDVLPGERELLVFAIPAVHEIALGWLEGIDRNRIDTRFFRLLHHAIAAVDTATAERSDPFAREVRHLLTPRGTLGVDLARNGLLVTDEPATLDRVNERLAALDRPPAEVTLEVAVLEVPLGAPLRGFQPLNDLPAAFADNGQSGFVACHSPEAVPVDELVAGTPTEGDANETAVLRAKAHGSDPEGKPFALEVPGLGSELLLTPRLAPGGVDLEARMGTLATHVRATSRRPVAIRGVIKTAHWGNGWSDARTEIVVVVRATPERELVPQAAGPEKARDRLPPLVSPDAWVKASEPK
jgi:hypothetical protein